MDRFARSIGAKHFMTSAKSGASVDQVFDDLAQLLVGMWPNGPPSGMDGLKIAGPRDKSQDGSRCGC